MVQNSKKTEALAIKERAISLSRKDFTKNFYFIGQQIMSYYDLLKKIYETYVKLDKFPLASFRFVFNIIFGNKRITLYG